MLKIQKSTSARDSLLGMVLATRSGRVNRRAFRCFAVTSVVRKPSRGIASGTLERVKGIESANRWPAMADPCLLPPLSACHSRPPEPDRAPKGNFGVTLRHRGFPDSTSLPSAGCSTSPSILEILCRRMLWRSAAADWLPASRSAPRGRWARVSRVRRGRSMTTPGWTVPLARSRTGRPNPR